MELITSQPKSLAQKLEGKREGSYWKAHCPAHEDAKSSLSISEKAGTRSVSLPRRL